MQNLVIKVGILLQISWAVIGEHGALLEW